MDPKPERDQGRRRSRISRTKPTGRRARPPRALPGFCRAASHRRDSKTATDRLTSVHTNLHARRKGVDLGLRCHAEVADLVDLFSRHLLVEDLCIARALSSTAAARNVVVVVVVVVAIVLFTTAALKKGSGVLSNDVNRDALWTASIMNIPRNRRGDELTEKFRFWTDHDVASSAPEGFGIEDKHTLDIRS